MILSTSYIKIAKTSGYKLHKNSQLQEYLDIVDELADSDLTDELKLTKALLMKWLNDYNEWEVFFTRWNRSFDKAYIVQQYRSIDDSSEELDPMTIRPTKPDKFISLSDAMPLLTRIQSIYESIEREKQNEGITREQLKTFYEKMGQVVVRVIEEEVVDNGLAEKLKHRIRDGWKALTSRK